MAQNSKSKEEKKTSSSKSNNREIFIEAYISSVLEHEKKPKSVYKFVKELKKTEADFYKEFNSLQSLEKHVWKSFIDKTIERIEGDAAYAEYMVRERLLAFYFTLVEVLNDNRSYVMYQLSRMPKGKGTPEAMKAARSAFEKFANDLIIMGTDTEEIVSRPFISDRYKDGLWLQLLFVVDFWRKDDSAEFEQTDAAIEKAVNLSMDLMGKSPVDTLIDFAKFVFQNRS
ncbi:MAG: TetR/AcrR family transcriptional regulator [Cyclobacteriaceae bacterium]|nr:TetR/AcrR family transcriptional regulator [Cyclobacteriaceae bacterium]MCH8515400.1 TetR/AcrR family transcriptional regulator [Cyclobacteriaceae bacterium]